MVSENIYVGDASAGFFDKDGTKVVERFWGLWSQALIDLIEEVAKLKIIYSAFELKSLKVFWLEGLRRLKSEFGMDGLIHYYFQVGLNSLHQKLYVGVSYTVLSDYHSEFITADGIDALPDAWSRLGIAEKDVQEADDSPFLCLLLSILIGLPVSLNHYNVLDIIPEQTLDGPRNDLGLEYFSKPTQSSFQIDPPQMSNIKPWQMDELG